MTWWQTILLTLITASVPAVISWVLRRKGANKRLELEEGSLSVSQFNAQTTAYQDLLDRANKALADANKTAVGLADELKTYKSERESLVDTVKKQGTKIELLQEADNEKTDALIRTNGKLETLRGLFLSYVTRTGIPLTMQEQAIFDDTLPSDIVRSLTKNPPITT